MRFRAIGVILAAILAFPAPAGEPSKLADVKTLVLRDDREPGTGDAAWTNSAWAICRDALVSKLSEAGFVVQPEAQGADAELHSLMVFHPVGAELEINCSVRITSMPSGHQLFSFVGARTNSLASACKHLSADVVKKIMSSKSK
jgi:hypothetical protein